MGCQLLKVVLMNFIHEVAVVEGLHKYLTNGL